MIAARLGHASIKLTMDTYGHLFDNGDRDAADAMDRLFDKGGSGEKQGAEDSTKKKIVSIRARGKTGS